MSTDQYTFTDPRTLYPAISPPIQQQEEPGIQARMEPIPDLGEHTVELVDYRAAEHSSPAVIRESVALWLIAFAREGADVAISYLPEEEGDSPRPLPPCCPSNASTSAHLSSFGMASLMRIKPASGALVLPSEGYRP